MKKSNISSTLRSFRLLYLSDKIRYLLVKIKNAKFNNQFKRNNPEVILPPDYLMYESFQLHYEKYYVDGKETANWLIDHLSKHIDLREKSILDWGCGPGRIIRHLPDMLGESCNYYGTDYNENSIKWCAKNLTDISFNHNSLKAELPYKDNQMDVIYGISIFTHLSKEMHFEWFNELYRILKIGGVMFLTTQGDQFKAKLIGKELEDFSKGELVVRGKVKEGHRTYSAFHPKVFMLKLFSNMKILNHIEERTVKGNWIPQDIWVIKK